MSPEIRELAAQLCSASACIAASEPKPFGVAFNEVCEAFDEPCHDGKAANLARQALWSFEDGVIEEEAEWWAEAEARLREGWEPNDDSSNS